MMSLAHPFRFLLLIESGGHGGAESVVFRLAREARRRGANVGVATFRTGALTESLRRAEIPHHFITTNRACDMTLPFRIARIIRKAKYELLHSHLVDSNFYGALAARIAGVPHIATEHGDVHHINQKRFLRAKLRTLSFLGSTVVAVSQFTAQAVMRGGVAGHRVRVLPNPVDFITPASDARARLRSSLGLDLDPRQHWLWLNVANLLPVKDQALLLRAFRRSREQCPIPQSLVLIGSGPEYPSLIALAEELGLHTAIHFAGNVNNVPEWLAAADGFVLSSQSEAMPVSLLEAAAAGKVIVSTAVGGIPEVINESSGFLVPAGDLEQLAGTLTSAVMNPSLTALRAATAEEFVRAHFSTEAVVDRYWELYRLLLSPHSDSVGIDGKELPENEPYPFRK